MQIVEEMTSFVEFWDLVQEVELSGGHDTISWKQTVDGVYTTKLAYNAQLLGSYRSLRGESVWTAEAEGQAQVLHLVIAPM